VYLVVVHLVNVVVDRGKSVASLGVRKGRFYMLGTVKERGQYTLVDWSDRRLFVYIELECII